MTSFLNLTENYSTTKMYVNQPIGEDIRETIEIPVIDESKLKSPLASSYKIRCSTVVPMAVGAFMTASNFGLWENLAPYILPLVGDVGRIFFYINGARAIYNICQNDMKTGINKLKNASIGYALIIGLDGIMYFIEYYVNNVKAGIMAGGNVGSLILGVL